MLRKIRAFGGWVTHLVLVGCVLLGAAGMAFAEGAPAPGAPIPPPAVPGAEGMASQQPGMMGMLLPFLLMFGVVYFLMIRPQQKKVKEQQSMLGGLQKGDEVVTSSGFLGTVHGIADKVVTLELNDNVKVKLLKSQIAQVVKGQLKEL